LVEAELSRLDDERRAALDRDVVRDLKRALRGFGRRLPHYELPHVASPLGDPATAPEGGAVEEGAAEPESGGESLPTDSEEIPLFPVGPLARVRIVPEMVRVAPGAERRVRAVAMDVDGRVFEGATFAWTIADTQGAGVELRGEGARAVVAAKPSSPIGATALLCVEARADDRAASAEARIEVSEHSDDASTFGIPEPQLVSDSDGRWRSRMRADRWEVNDAHEDYRSLRGEPRGRVRYLLALLAKEIVLRTSGRVDAEDVLEQVVEVLAHAERNLRGS
jgi:hypothetical protein